MFVICAPVRSLGLGWFILETFETLVTASIFLLLAAKASSESVDVGWSSHHCLNVSLGLLFQRIHDSLGLDLRVRSRSIESGDGKFGMDFHFLYRSFKALLLA